MFDFLLQQEGLLIPKNASRMQQLQKQGSITNRCDNLFDAMDAQLPTPTSGKKSACSKIADSLGKPGMFSILSSFVLFVIPSTEFFVHAWTSCMYMHCINSREPRLISHLCSAPTGEK